MTEQRTISCPAAHVPEYARRAAAGQPRWRSVLERPDATVVKVPMSFSHIVVWYWPVELSVRAVDAPGGQAIATITGRMPLGVGPLQRGHIRRVIDKMATGIGDAAVLTAGTAPQQLTAPAVAAPSTPPTPAAAAVTPPPTPAPSPPAASPAPAPQSAPGPAPTAQPVPAAQPAPASAAEPSVTPAEATAATSAQLKQPAAESANAETRDAPGAPDPGWYPDPSGQFTDRWWDGSGWTERTR